MSKSSKKNKKKKVNIISYILFSLLLIIGIILCVMVIPLGILPLKFLIPILLVVGLIYFGIGKVIFSKKARIWVKIVFDVIIVAGIALCVFLYNYLNSTLNFMDKIKAGTHQTENYYVIVEKDSNAEDLYDLDNLGVYDSNTVEYNKALDKLEEEIKLDEEMYDSYVELSEALFDKDVDAIFMSASYMQIVSEMVENFEKNTKIIHTIEIKSETGVVASELDPTKDSFNVYISGVDIYGSINSVSRSDVNMIATINPKTHKILLTSIPRDYYVQLHGTTGSRDKLTHAGMYGVDMSISTIEDLFEIDIDYYVRVNFTTLINLVDAIGGIDVYSDAAFTAWTDHSCHYRVGTMHLNGKCALAFARERMAYLEGDRHRVKNQQDIIAAIMKKTLSSDTLINKYTDILESLGDSFQTNFPEKKIYELINIQLSKMPSWKLETNSVNGTDSENGTYTFGSQKLYVMEPDMETVEEAKVKINKIMKK